MTKEWSIEKTKETWKEVEKAREYIIHTIENLEVVSEDERNDLLNEIKNGSYAIETVVLFGLATCLDDFDKAQKIIHEKDFQKSLDLLNFYDNPTYRKNKDTINLYERYVDSEILHVDGDIIITDPGYIAKDNVDYSTSPYMWDFLRYKTDKEYPDYDPETRQSAMYYEDYDKFSKAKEKWEKENESDWEKCGYGQNMKILGLEAITSDTLYGDWSCSVYDITKKPKKIGEFCADAGMVGVFKREEVLKYNPSFEKDLAAWCYCTIKNFCGDVQIKITEETYKDNKKDYVCKVYGKGIDKTTGKELVFESRQTGL